MNHILTFVFFILVANGLLYLSINKSELFLYPFVSFLIFVNYLVLLRLVKLETTLYKNKTEKIENNILEESADNHPIIQSARKRLGK